MSHIINARNIDFQDVQWNDIDYMNDRNDFTIKPEFSDLNKFVKNLHDVR